MYKDVYYSIAFSGKKNKINQLEITSIKAYHRTMCTVWSYFCLKKDNGFYEQQNLYTMYIYEKKERNLGLYRVTFFS